MNEHLQSEISDFRHLMEGRIWPMGSSEHQPVTGCLAQVTLSRGQLGSQGRVEIRLRSLWRKTGLLSPHFPQISHACVNVCVCGLVCVSVLSFSLVDQWASWRFRRFRVFYMNEPRFSENLFCGHGKCRHWGIESASGHNSPLATYIPLGQVSKDTGVVVFIATPKSSWQCFVVRCSV